MSGLGSYDDDKGPGWFEAIFLAEITAATLVNGIYVYDWNEQVYDATGTPQPQAGARSGSAAVTIGTPGAIGSGGATEANNNLVPFPSFRWMRFKTMVGGNPTYEFDACCGSPPTSSGSSSNVCTSLLVGVTAACVNGQIVVTETYICVCFPPGTTISQGHC
jgi:hypothetical protein